MFRCQRSHLLCALSLTALLALAGPPADGEAGPDLDPNGYRAAPHGEAGGDLDPNG